VVVHEAERVGGLLLGKTLARSGLERGTPAAAAAEQVGGTGQAKRACLEIAFAGFEIVSGGEGAGLVDGPANGFAIGSSRTSRRRISQIVAREGSEPDALADLRHTDILTSEHVGCLPPRPIRRALSARRFAKYARPFSDW